jgi:RNA polymerase sigma factor (sigma-70 family)
MDLPIIPNPIEARGVTEPPSAESPAAGVAPRTHRGAVVMEQRLKCAAALLEAHHAEIHRYLWRVLSRPADADHLSRETFLRAFWTHRFQPPGANVRAWLFTIATKLCRNHVRSERRRAARPASSEEPWTGDGGRPGPEAIFSEARQAQEIIGRLPLNQRLGLTMRKFHDLDYDIIGASLGCSADSARAHVFRGLRKIRHGIDPASRRALARGRV